MRSFGANSHKTGQKVAYRPAIAAIVFLSCHSIGLQRAAKRREAYPLPSPRARLQPEDLLGRVKVHRG